MQPSTNDRERPTAGTPSGVPRFRSVGPGQLMEIFFIVSDRFIVLADGARAPHRRPDGIEDARAAAVPRADDPSWEVSKRWTGPPVTAP